MRIRISTAEDVVELGYTRVGVIATAFTVHSQCYPKLIDELKSDIDVYGEPSAKLAALIEQGLLHHGQHDRIGSVHINTTGERPVYETVLGELNVTRPYTLTRRDFATGETLREID